MKKWWGGRMGFLVAALVAGVLVYTVTLSPASQAATKGSAESMTIASGGPLDLTSEPAQAVLVGKNLAAQAETLAPNQRIYLVLRDLHAAAQPATLYHVYLDLPQGSKPEKDDVHLAGLLNFYNAVPADGGTPASGQFRSFDVTMLVKNLLERKALSNQTTVTVIPSGAPASGANASIGRIEIAVQ